MQFIKTSNKILNTFLKIFHLEWKSVTNSGVATSK
jgi:hypothetical protein